MAQTPHSIEVNIVNMPLVRELLAEAWEEGYTDAEWDYRGEDGFLPEGDRMNPYRTEAIDAD